MLTVLPALLVTELPLLFVRLVDESPKPEDVKAGWTAFVVFLLLAVAVAVLGLSLTKHLRRAKDAQAAGVYGDEPEPGRRTADAPVTDPSSTDEPPSPTGRP